MKVRNNVYENMSDESIDAQERTAARLRAETIGKAAEQIQQEFDDGFHGRKSPLQNAVEEALKVDAFEDLHELIRLAGVEIQTLKDTIAERDALLLDFQRFMRHHARRLAVAGSYDHKGKNEVLLSVIGGLLDAAENAIRVTTVEDVPF